MIISSGLVSVPPFPRTQSVTKAGSASTPAFRVRAALCVGCGVVLAEDFGPCSPIMVRASGMSFLSSAFPGGEKGVKFTQHFLFRNLHGSIFSY